RSHDHGCGPDRADLTVRVAGNHGQRDDARRGDRVGSETAVRSDHGIPHRRSKLMIELPILIWSPFFSVVSRIGRSLTKVGLVPLRVRIMTSPAEPAGRSTACSRETVGSVRTT